VITVKLPVPDRFAGTPPHQWVKPEQTFQHALQKKLQRMTSTQVLQFVLHHAIQCLGRPIEHLPGQNDKRTMDLPAKGPTSRRSDQHA
jgi:hypothetical protein